MITDPVRSIIFWFSIFASILFFISCEDSQKGKEPEKQKITKITSDYIDIKELLNITVLTDLERLRDSILKDLKSDSLHQKPSEIQYLDGKIAKHRQDFDEARSHFEEIVQVENQIELQLLAKMELTNIYIVERNRVEALSSLLKINDLITKSELRNPDLLYRLKILEGEVYYLNHRYQAALDIFLQAIDSSEFEDQEYSLKIKLYNSIALTLMDLSKHEEALGYLEEALKLSDTNIASTGLAKIYNNKANAYGYLLQYEQAIDIYKIALSINKELDRKTGIIRNYYNIGDAYKYLDLYEEAISNFTIAMEMSKDLDFTPGLMYNAAGLGISYLAQDNAERAYYYFDIAEQLSREMDEKAVLFHVLDGLIQLEKSNQNYQLALSYFEEYLELQMVYHELVLNQDIEKLMIANEVESTIAENEYLREMLALNESINRQKNTVLGVLLALFITIAVFAYVIYRSRSEIQLMNDQQHQKNLQIDKKNEDLLAIIKERDALARMIVHDLRNPLSAIRTSAELLKIDDNDGEDQEVLIGMLTSSASNLDILISSLLNSYGSVIDHDRKTSQVTNVKRMVSKIKHGFTYQAKSKNIKIVANLEDFDAPIDQNTFYSICGNLISNAIKYSREGTKVEITTYLNEDYWFLKVQDQGPGFTVEDQQNMFRMFSTLSAKPTGNEISTGLGLHSVKKSIEKIGGKIELNTDYTEGAEFICSFPISSQVLQQV